MQLALDVKYDKMTGALYLEELNEYLTKDYNVILTEPSSGGDILVIIQSPSNE